jgi:hypothetical protein
MLKILRLIAPTIISDMFPLLQSVASAFIEKNADA